MKSSTEVGQWLFVATCVAFFGGIAVLAGPGYFLASLVSSIVLTAGFHWWACETRELDPAAPLGQRVGMALAVWCIAFMLSVIGLGVLMLLAGH